MSATLIAESETKGEETHMSTTLVAENEAVNQCETKVEETRVSTTVQLPISESKTEALIDQNETKGETRASTIPIAESKILDQMDIKRSNPLPSPCSRAQRAHVKSVPKILPPCEIKVPICTVNTVIERRRTKNKAWIIVPVIAAVGIATIMGIDSLCGRNKRKKMLK